MPARSHKPRIAIVGGGCAAMTTAYELTHGENAGRYDVTVYQMGWRLGGKGASGRGRGGRIEEHGPHLWMGHYDNAFGLMRRCYADLGLDWRQAFTPASDMGLMHPGGEGGWETLLACFPPLPGTPGDPRQLGPGDFLSRTVKLLMSLLQAAEQAGREPPPANLSGRRQVEREGNGEAADGWRRWLNYGELGVLTAAQYGLSIVQHGLDADPGSPAPNRALSSTLDEISVSLQNLLGHVMARDTASRYLWEIVDVVLAQVRGGIRMMRDSLTLDDINRYDIRDWLRQNGAAESSLQSSFVRGLYDLAFAYEDRDPERAGIAAGEGLLGSARMFMTYRESLFWKMQGGMGDVVFAPLYRELKRCGVHFEFFHRLENVGLARGKSLAAGDVPHVNSLTFTVQARGAGHSEYEPLVDYAGVPCWPAEPCWERLQHGDALRAAGIDFESPSSPGIRNRILHVGDDFDLVALGISIGSVPATCGELIRADERWRRMARHVATMPIQSWRASVHPSDRYVLSLPGTIEHRISPLDRTWDNLTICGDWTDCGFNLGCVEAAVMSGRLAAHALSLSPGLDEIAAYDLV